MALQLSRRTVLKGVGTALSLPMLDAMLGSQSAAAAAGGAASEAPTRMAFVFFPNGAIMKDWTPQQDGRNFELPKTLKPLQAVKDDVLVVSGLAQDKARSNGDGAGDHARCSAAFLTGAQPRKTAGADIQVGQSVDQFAAEQIGNRTRLPSLELGLEAGKQAGKCDSGYSCAYQSNISWKTPTQPMAKEINPKFAFERLFGKPGDAKQAAERAFYRKSILDFVADDAAKLQKTLGQTDRRKLDEYFTSVREIEKRVAESQQKAAEIPDAEIPAGIPREFAEHARLMYDLMFLAFQTDTTRICTFMLANSGSNRAYREIEVKDGHHQLSHHRDDAAKIEQLQKIDEFMMQQFAYFLDRLRSVQEGERTLLDNCMIAYGCAISDANRHRHEDLPLLLAGRGGGTINTGRHLRVKEETPMNNLFLSMLDRVGVQAESLGDSTARLEQIA